MKILSFALRRILHQLCTTGFTEAINSGINRPSKDKSIGGLIAPNFAIGAILMKFAAEASNISQILKR